MIRVGPLRRIDRALLGHALHSNTRNRSEAAHELGEMLKQSTSPSEMAVLQTELARVRQHVVQEHACMTWAQHASPLCLSTWQCCKIVHELVTLSISWCQCLSMELQVKAGAEKARKKKLKTAAVVGVTCCSAGGQLLDGQRFDIVVLDECSQMVEPLSLIPLLRASCRQEPFLPPSCLQRLLTQVS